MATFQFLFSPKATGKTKTLKKYLSQYDNCIFSPDELSKMSDEELATFEALSIEEVTSKEELLDCIMRLNDTNLLVVITSNSFS